MNLIPKSLFDQFDKNGCVWNVAKPANNPAICDELDGQVQTLIAGLNPYDLFRTTYGLGSTAKKSFFSRRLEGSNSNEEYGE